MHACPENLTALIGHRDAHRVILLLGRQVAESTALTSKGFTWKNYCSQKGTWGDRGDYGSKAPNLILMIEVSPQVNSPLAAIRNAIYLAARRTTDPEIIQYLAIADSEISSIVNRIRDLRAEVESMHGLEPWHSASDCQSEKAA